MSDVSTSKYVGNWTAASVDVFKESGDLSAENLLVLRADGTATITSGDEVDEYTWKETDSGVYLDSLGSKSDLKFKADGPDTLKTRVLFITVKFNRVK